MPDTHDERGGEDGRVQLVRRSLSDRADHIADDLAAIVRELRKEKAGTGDQRLRLAAVSVSLRMLRDDLVEQLAVATARAEKAEVRLAKLGTEWGVRFPDNQVEVCDSETDARDWANQNWPNGGGLTVMCRTTSKWRDAETADAPPDGQSATLRAEDGVQASGSELEFERPAAGLSARCRATKLDDGIRHHCDNNSGAPHIHECGDCAYQWDNDTTEDDRG